MNSTIASLLKVGVPYELLARYVEYAQLVRLTELIRRPKPRPER